jgi:hypothetical protein
MGKESGRPLQERSKEHEISTPTLDNSSKINYDAVRLDFALSVARYI